MLSDVAIKAAKPRDKTYTLPDGGGLTLEVLATGTKVWRLRYRLLGKLEKATLGQYPAYGLAEARQWREEGKWLASRGASPAALKQGAPLPADLPAVVKERAEAFIQSWCLEARAKAQAQAAAAAQAATTAKLVSTVAWEWYDEVVVARNKSPRTIQRALEKDIVPAIGDKAVDAVTVLDAQAITDAIKKRGSDQMALVTRNIGARLFRYAIARQLCTFNPFAALDANFIAQARSREVALTLDEVGRLLRAVYQSSMRRSHKLAVHLLILTLARKGEVIAARWAEINFEEKLWSVPNTRMKMGKPHLVPLAPEALALLEELRHLAGDSPFVVPSSHGLDKPIAASTLNTALRSLEHDVRDFVIHDFRRTASTHLHEAGYPADWIEKALAHETGGIRGVYNKAQYLDQRRTMLAEWATLVDRQLREGGKILIGATGRAFHANP